MLFPKTPCLLPQPLPSPRYPFAGHCCHHPDQTSEAISKQATSHRRATRGPIRNSSPDKLKKPAGIRPSSVQPLPMKHPVPDTHRPTFPLPSRFEHSSRYVLTAVKPCFPVYPYSHPHIPANDSFPIQIPYLKASRHNHPMQRKTMSFRPPDRPKSFDWVNPLPRIPVLNPNIPIL